MTIVWPCPLSVDAYVAGGRDIEFPRPDCPSCSCPMSFWSGYRRPVREAGLCHKIFVPRLRCGRCAVTHVLLPCFVLAGRLDVAETIGTVLEEVVDGPGGVRRRQHASMSFIPQRAVGCGGSLTGRCASASRSRRFASSSVARRSRPSPNRPVTRSQRSEPPSRPRAPCRDGPRSGCGASSLR